MDILRNIKRYLDIYQRYIGRRLYIIFGLTLLAALAEGFGIAMLLPLLQSINATDAAEMDSKTRLMYDFLDTMGMADSVGAILVFIALAFLGKGLLKFAEQGYQGYLQAQLLRELKTRLFDKYSNMELNYYNQRNTGHFINVINQQTNRFYSSFSQFTKFLSMFITTAGYMAIAFWMTWRFALMAMVAGGGILLLFTYLNRYVRDLSRKTSKEMSHLNHLLVQALQAFKYIVSTDKVDHMRQGINDSIYRWTGYTYWQKIAGAFTNAIKEPVSIFFIVMVIALQVTVYEQPLAPIFVSLLLFHRGMQSMIGIQRNWQLTMDKIGSVEMVDDEFNEVEQWQEKSGKEQVGRLANGITFDNVWFAYDKDDGPVLKDINIDIPVNNTVALVGESGAGKSTLVDLMTLMLKPQQGDIYIDGIAGSNIDLPTWRSQLGYVSQETVVFDDTIANNISMWAGEHSKMKEGELEMKVKTAAGKAYAAPFIKGLPNGYDTVVGDRGVRLSGGQRQRLFIARELFKRPNLLILDEATSALDTESERYIQDSIDGLKGEITVVIIAHRLSTIKNVDRVYVLDEGRVIEQGSYDELYSHDDSRFKEMVKMQSL
ncbi:ABC transporter ATP-binding protein [Fodinibius sp. AD559]|uniref:ABC transporter ATP-binding protein n=1 Tax=Fodinibius sp. AD559 TaxID=3424179 RepID=UPI0040469655